jgi:NAD(P)-dependent dehydrogenase (short-subunit alcohol dehydrogenase family)
MRENDVSFDGQRVIIVGGSAGIGEAAARAFAAAGAQVTITGRDKDRLDAAAQRIGHPVGVAGFDAADGPAVAGFFATAGPFDHLVLAASPGAVGSGPFAALEEQALRQAFDGKFFAHVKVLQAARPRLRADGSVTIVSAVSARAAYPGAAGLAAVNGALEAMVPTLAVELAPLRVNAVSPGIIDTQWWDGLPGEQRAGFFAAAAAASPAGRVGRPEDVAAAIVYLASAGFVTGTVLECTGGANLTVGAVAG